MLNNKTILITGGTGSFGKAFVLYIFEQYPDVKRMVIWLEVLNRKLIMALISLIKNKK